MNNVHNVILVGGFSEIVELCELAKIEIIGIIDNKLSGKYRDYEIIGTDEDAHNLYKKFSKIPVVISPDKPAVRLYLSQLYQRSGFRFCNLIHPGASISKTSKLGVGLVIQNHANVSSNVIINDFVKINVGANIMHDCVVGRFTTIAPNAVLLGRVSIGSGCYIGAQSTILNDIVISDKAVVGAAAVVTKNVNKSSVVKGNPA
jgi:sugar O-acyltransferase (sialic acid O-acetyltransferase NeuD family)